MDQIYIYIYIIVEAEMSYCIIESFLDFAAKLWKPKRLPFFYTDERGQLLSGFLFFQFSPILIWMNAMEIKQSKGQKKKPQNSLFTFSTVFVTSPPFSDYLSISPNRSNLSIRLSEGIKTKRNKGYEFCACNFIIFGKSDPIGFLLRKVEFKDKDGNLTSTLHASIFLTSPALWE